MANTREQAAHSGTPQMTIENVDERFYLFGKAMYKVHVEGIPQRSQHHNPYIDVVVFSSLHCAPSEYELRLHHKHHS